MTGVIALLGAPVAWAVHLAISYFLVAVDCGTAWNGGRTGVVLATIVCAAAGIAAGGYGWRGWRRVRSSDPQDLEAATNTQEFLLLGGVVLALPFTVAVILSGLSSVMLPMCT